jgi:drug/metabolite transporter (DMT)-like permease
LKGIPASAVAAATLSTAALLVAPVAIYTWPAHAIPTTSWLSAVLLGVLCTGTAFVIYYRLIHRIGGSRAAAVTYLIPLFGPVWAWLILGESITRAMVIAAALILGGVALNQQRASKA